MIVGIILSAGESSRMGTPKQLLAWGKTIIIQQVVDNATASQLETVLLVLGHRAEKIAGNIAVSSKTRILVNPDYKEGMGSSVKCGVGAAPVGAGAFMVLLGDQPFIGSDIIDKVIDSHHRGGHGITIPTYDGRRGHPVIFDSCYREELLSIGEGGAREVVRRHAGDVFELPLDSPSILVDIDTPEQYRQAIEDSRIRWRWKS